MAHRFLSAAVYGLPTAADKTLSPAGGVAASAVLVLAPDFTDTAVHDSCLPSPCFVGYTAMC